jgi:hypothetical protein
MDPMGVLGNGYVRRLSSALNSSQSGRAATCAPQRDDTGERRRVRSRRRISRGFRHWQTRCSAERS